MFLGREDGGPYPMRTVSNANRAFLRALKGLAPRPTGRAIVTESRKLMRFRPYFERHGYRYRGKWVTGLDVWLAGFAECEAPAPMEDHRA